MQVPLQKGELQGRQSLHALPLVPLDPLPRQAVATANRSTPQAVATGSQSTPQAVATASRSTADEDWHHYYQEPGNADGRHHGAGNAVLAEASVR